MAQFDLPLDQLRRYPGTNPRPDDFDAYWDRALAELDRQDPAAEWVPNDTLSARAAECFDLWFTGVGGARLHAQFLRPRASSGRGPALLQFHGYSMNAGDWAEKLGYASQGFCVAALDCRGQGGKSADVGRPIGSTLQGHVIRGVDEADPQRLLFRSIYLDTVQLARLVLARPDVDPARLGAMGGSQGGGLALACAALEPRVRRVVSVHPFLCDYQRVWELDQPALSNEELRYYLRRFDPRHERLDRFFTRLGYIDCQHLAPRIGGEVLMFTGLRDTICPPSTQFAAYHRIRAPKEMLVYPEHAHEPMPDQADRSFTFLSAL